MKILLPDGGVRESAPIDPGTRLSDALEAWGVPLNQRCGGRGLCRGCQVRRQEEERPFRSCQTTVADLPSDAVLLVPRESLRDQSLFGVSAFELRIPLRHLDRRPGLGLALDIGTTTVAASLWDLETGACLATQSRGNAQRRHGDNVLSRISHAADHPGGILDLQRALVAETLDPLLSGLEAASGRSRDSVVEAIASGNPVMLHTLAGEPLDGFACYPFAPAFLDRRTLRDGLEALNLPVGVTALPGLGPFVGSDILMGALATGMLDEGPPALLIDFGTNGEILLKTRKGFLATATAAGPAFEGGRLRCGATARAGVLSSLRRRGGHWDLRYIGNGGDKGHGISGAAYVDFMALGREEGWINAFGRFDRQHPGVRTLESGGETEWVADLGDGLLVSEADVAELLQAKAAIAAGTATLLEIAGLHPGTLDRVYVAGGFGYQLEPGHALRIGLLPAVEPGKIELVGNTSLGGASALLLAGSALDLESALAHTSAVELNQVLSFQDHFTDALLLDGDES